MNRLRPLWVLLALLLFATCSYLQLGRSVPKVSAQAGCSVASLNGGYGFLLNKWTSDPSSSASAIIGVLNADGSGNLSGSFTNYDSNAMPPLTTGTFTGTYAVNPDCSGSQSVTTDTGVILQYAIVITDAGSNVQLMLTTNDPNSVQTGTGRRQ